MRAPLATLLAAFVLAGCVSGTRTIVVREYPVATPVVTPTPRPAPVPAPLPAPRRLAQLEIALGSPAAGKVPVQTNRSAYVAIFEIIPQQGVTLLHPATPKQSRTVMSGLSWVSVLPGATPTARRVSNSGRPTRAVRYIYALASDTPLRIPDRAIEPGYLEQVLGPAAFRAASPQAAVRALSRQFAPKVSEEQWAEDLYAVEPRNSSAPPRTARIYCWDGRMYEVPEDIADRAWCPERPGTNDGGVMPTPARPDSVVGNNGRRIGPRVPRTPGRTADLPDRQPEDRAKPDHPVKPEHPSTPRNDQAEKEKEKAENDRAEKEKKDKAEKDRADKEKKEKADKEKADKERADQAERERAEKEKAEKQKKDKDEADRAEREKADKEKADKDKADKRGEGDEAGAPGKSDDSSDAGTPGAGKPDESDKADSSSAKGSDRKPADKSKPSPKADSTKNAGSKGTPNRGRNAP